MAKNNREIKTTFKIDGEAEYKRSIKNINSDLKVLSSEMEEVNSRYDKNEKSMRKLKETNEILNKQYDTQKKKIQTLKDAVANSAKAYDDAVEVYDKMVKEFGENSTEAEKAAKAVDKAKASVDNFTIQLNKSQKELNKTEKAIDGVQTELAELKNQEIDELIPEKATKNIKITKEQLDEVAKSAKSVATTCGKAAVEAGKLGAKTLKVSLEASAKALAAYASAAAAAGTAIFNLAAESGAFADDINTLSKQTGLDTESLQAYTYASSLIDVEVETIAKSMAKLTKNMTSTSKEVQGAFQTLGVSIRDNVTGELRNNEEVFNDLIKALGEIENETERDNLAMQIFGKSAQDLNPLILGGAEDLQKFAQSAKAAGLILSQEALDDLNAFNDSLDILKGNLSSAGKVISVDFAQKFKPVTDKIGEAVPKIAKAFGGMFDPETAEKSGQEFREEIISLTTDIGRDIEDMLPVFLDGMNSIFMGLIDVLPSSVASLLPYLVDGLTNLVIEVVRQIPVLLPTVVNAGLDLFSGLLTGLNKALDELNPLLPGIVRDVMDRLTENLPTIISGAYQLFIGLLDGLASAMPEILRGITELVPEMANEITKEENLNRLIQTGVDLVAAIAEGLPQALPALIEALGKVITELANAEISYEDLGKIGTAMGETLVNSFTSILSVIDGLLGTKFAEWYSQYSDLARQFGADIYAMTHADELAQMDLESKTIELRNDITRKFNTYVRDEGLSAEEALERAKNDAIKTDEQKYIYTTYLADEYFNAEAIEGRANLVLEIDERNKQALESQIASNNATLAEQRFEMVSNAVPSAPVDYSTWASGNTTNITFNNTSPIALTAEEQIRQNRQQAQVANIYGGGGN